MRYFLLCRISTSDEDMCRVRPVYRIALQDLERMGLMERPARLALRLRALSALLLRINTEMTPSVNLVRQVVQVGLEQTFLVALCACLPHNACVHLAPLAPHGTQEMGLSVWHAQPLVLRAL